MRKQYELLNESNETDIDMTPMLDIVFIMLIFFIVTTSFIKESGIEVNSPQAKSASKDKSANIIIAISESGDIWIDKKRVDIRSLRSHIERLHVDTPDGSVVITADKKAYTGILVEVMDQVRLSGIEKISVGAKSELK